MKRDEKIIKVYRHNKFLDYTTKKRAERLVNKTREARYITDDSIELIGGRKERAVIKRSLLRKNGRECYICGRIVPDTEPLTLDHIIPKSNNGEDKEENCALCCRDCNRDKKNDDILFFIQRIRENIKEYPCFTEDRLSYLESKYRDFS